jgi:hypothetical protein
MVSAASCDGAFQLPYHFPCWPDFDALPHTTHPAYFLHMQRSIKKG